MDIKTFLVGIGKFRLFHYFCIEHIISILLFFVLLILLILFRKKVFELSEKNKSLIKWVGIILIIVFHLIYRGSLLYYGVFKIESHLDLYFCYIVMYLFLISQIFNLKKLFILIFPLVFMGPLITVFYPSIVGGFYSFGFYHCFITHNFLILLNVFIYFAYDFKLEFKNILKSFILANLIVLSVLIVNSVFGLHYNELSGLINGVLLSKLNFYFNNYLILYEFICVFGCIISYVISSFKLNYNK